MGKDKVHRSAWGGFPGTFHDYFDGKEVVEVTANDIIGNYWLLPGLCLMGRPIPYIIIC